jgi:hypothetical protein
MATVVAAHTLGALDEFGAGDIPHYRHALARACDAHPPPFGTKAYGDIFRAAAFNPEWLARSLVANAEKEGDGARRLWNLAASTSDERVASKVRQQAIDESRHSRLYGVVLDIVYPNAVGPELRPLIRSLSPGFNQQSKPAITVGSPFAHEVTLDDLVQLNIAEIRTRIHQQLQGPVLMAHCRSARRDKLPGLLTLLARDELKHIAYTASLIEEFACRGQTKLVVDLMEARLFDFNELTRCELDSRMFPVI